MEGSSTLLCGLPSCSKEATSDCASCKTQGYCSKEHQHGDWKAHKVECKRITKARKAASKKSGAAKEDDRFISAQNCPNKHSCCIKEWLLVNGC